MRPQLELIIESRVRIINITMISNIQTNWIFEYLYNQGLRLGDIICTVVNDPKYIITVSDLDSDEPLF